jgi:acyl carrier protein
MNISIDQLREIIVKAEITQKDPALFDPDQLLRAQGLDSLDMATFVFFLEEELGISIPHTEYKRLGSLRAMADALNEQGDSWKRAK